MLSTHSNIDVFLAKNEHNRISILQTLFRQDNV